MPMTYTRTGRGTKPADAHRLLRTVRDRVTGEPVKGGPPRPRPITDAMRAEAARVQALAAAREAAGLRPIAYDEVEGLRPEERA